eukprot:scaffold85266_cov33-Tisochrysis_lutea.AAC.3
MSSTRMRALLDVPEASASGCSSGSLFNKWAARSYCPLTARLRRESARLWTATSLIIERSLCWS